MFPRLDKYVRLAEFKSLQDFIYDIMHAYEARDMPKFQKTLKAMVLCHSHRVNHFEQNIFHYILIKAIRNCGPDNYLFLIQLCKYINYVYAYEGDIDIDYVILYDTMIHEFFYKTPSRFNMHKLRVLREYIKYASFQILLYTQSDVSQIPMPDIEIENYLNIKLALLTNKSLELSDNMVPIAHLDELYLLSAVFSRWYEFGQLQKLHGGTLRIAGLFIKAACAIQRRWRKYKNKKLKYWIAHIVSAHGLSPDIGPIILKFAI